MFVPDGWVEHTAGLWVAHCRVLRKRPVCQAYVLPFDKLIVSAVPLHDALQLGGHGDRRGSSGIP